MSEKNPKLVLMGRCNKAHGLHGAFFLVLINEQNSQLAPGKEVYIRRDGVEQKLSIKKISFGGKTICQFEEVSNLNDLEPLLPFEMWMNRSDFGELKDGEIYLSDLLDYQVIDPENSSMVGKVVGLSSNGAQDLLQITWGEEEFDLPFVNQFFPNIDQEKKILYFNPPEFLE